jgi:hypothetical protein
MRRFTLVTAALFSVSVCATIYSAWTAACGDYGATTLEHWADLAISADEQAAARAIESLRRRGPAGLDAIVDRHASLLDEQQVAAGPDDQAERNQLRLRLFTAMDQIAGQRDCRASRLFWHTNLEKAKAAALAQNKPILSLRMMGKLTDEYSCANSRFFRTTLYANSEVGKMLRERFVLHWESVRPVPKVIIDFGDGRKLQRTLTGNSIHYVLASDGRVIDAIPGLYSAKAFLAVLADAESFFQSLRTVKPEKRDVVLARYYRDRMTAIASNWASDLRKVGVIVGTSNNNPPVGAAAAPDQPNQNPPNAGKAAARAVSKSLVEMPILNQLPLAQAPMPSAEELTSATPENLWPQIAALHFDEAALDEASRALIASKNPTAGRAAEAAITKLRVESPLVRMFRNLQESIAVDTVRNEYLFRRQILEWLAGDSPSLAGDVFALNERVYAELFLTPRRDPWLGLLPADTYTALENDGVVAAKP